MEPYQFIYIDKVQNDIARIRFLLKRLEKTKKELFEMGIDLKIIDVEANQNFDKVVDQWLR